MWPLGPSARQPGNIGRDGTLPPGPPRASTGVLDWLRRAFGGWAGTLFSRGSPAEKALTEEKASSGPRGIILPWLPPYQDLYTGETAEHRRCYRIMWSDCNVKSALASTIFGVGDLDLQMIQASQDHSDGQIADFVTYCLTRRVNDGFPGIVWSLLGGGLVDGYSLCEQVLQLDDHGKWAGKIVLDRFVPLDVGFDVALETDDHRRVTNVLGLRYNAGLKWDTSAFTHYRHMPLYGSPVGMSLLRSCYRPWWLLSAAEALRGIALEKRAVPILLGHYPPGGAVKASLEAALAMAKSQTWLSVPEGVKVEVLNVAGQADNIFKSACDSWKHDIFLSISGAYLQAVEGTTQSGRGSSKVHKSTADLIKWYLSTTIETALNGLIKTLVDLNFVVTQGYPNAKLSSVDTEELTQLAGIVKSLNGIGLDLSKADLYDVFARQSPDKDDPDDRLPGAPQKPPGGGGAAAMADTMSVPAAEVPGEVPFRFSEGWRQWLGNGHRSNGRGVR